MVKAAGWRSVTTWVLEGTYLEVQPNAASGWFITDVRTQRSLSQALKIGQAKRIAEKLLARTPALWRDDGKRRREERAQRARRAAEARGELPPGDEE